MAIGLLGGPEYTGWTGIINRGMSDLIGHGPLVVMEAS